MTVRTWALRVVLAGAVVSLAACRQNAADAAQGFLASGDRYMTAGQTAAAVLEYRNAIGRQPTNAEAHYRLAKAYEALGQYDNALRSFVEVSRLDDRHPDADVHVAEAWLAAGRYADAVTLADRVLAKEPRNVRALTTSALALDGTGKRDLAARRIADALAIEPRSSSALIARASLERSKGEPAAARRTLREVLAVNPKAIDAWTALASLEEADGQPAAAERALQEALNRASDKMPAHRLLAAFYRRTGNVESLLPHLQVLAESNAEDRLALADVYLGRGEYDTARPLLDGLSRDKRFAGEVALRRAAVAAAGQQWTEAARALEGALADSRTEARARALNANLLARTNRLDEAVEQAQRAAGLEPRWPDAQYAIGTIQFARGDYVEAARALKRARDLGGDRAAIDYQLARLALAQGDPDAAERAARSAADARPHPTTQALLARVLRQKGDDAGAREVVTDATRRWGPTPDIEVERGYLELATKHPAEARAAFGRALALLRTRARGATARSVDAAAPFEPTAEDLSTSTYLAILAARLDYAEGKREQAERTLRALVTRSPDDLDAASALADLYLATGKRAQAIEYYERVAQRRRSPATELTVLGALKAEAGDTAGAAAAYRRALDIDDTSSGIAANNLAWLLAEEGRIDEAVQMAERAARVLADAAPALDTLGWMYLQAGRGDEAVRRLTAARDKAPANPTYHYHLGVAYAQTGRVPEARAALERALTLSSTFSDAGDARARLQQLSTVQASSSTQR